MPILIPGAEMTIFIIPEAGGIPVFYDYFTVCLTVQHSSHTTL